MLIQYGKKTMKIHSRHARRTDESIHPTESAEYPSSSADFHQMSMEQIDSFKESRSGFADGMNGAQFQATIAHHSAPSPRGPVIHSPNTTLTPYLGEQDRSLDYIGVVTQMVGAMEFRRDMASLGTSHRFEILRESGIMKHQYSLRDESGSVLLIARSKCLSPCIYLIDRSGQVCRSNFPTRTLRQSEA